MAARVWYRKQEGHNVRADGVAVGGGLERGWAFGTVGASGDQ